MKSMPQTIIVPKTLSWSPRFLAFAQKMANRLAFGKARYKHATDPRQDYLKRLRSAVDSFEATGNLEYLVDAANYCCLEFYWSLHPQAHFRSRDSRGHGLIPES